MNMLIRCFILMTLLKRQHKNNQNQSPNQDIRQASTQANIQNQLLVPFKSTYRILPHDMGFRTHLPNYRYLSFIELNIEGWLRQSLQPKSNSPNTANQQNKVKWVISMQELVYLKEIKFLDKMTISSQLEGWDTKYIYFQHHFYVNNELRAIGLTKFILVNKKGKLSPEVLGLESENLTGVIHTWNANQMAIKQQK